METFSEFLLNEKLKEIGGRWALVSIKTGKPLAYYDGEGKPSLDWVQSEERRINYFKHMNK